MLVSYFSGAYCSFFGQTVHIAEPRAMGPVRKRVHVWGLR